MILFLMVEMSIILAGLIIILGHFGFANKFLANIFFLILLAVVAYLIQLYKE